MCSVTAGYGKCFKASLMCPPTSPSCKRLATTDSKAVPETTPSCPHFATSLAKPHDETAAPIPP